MGDGKSSQSENALKKGILRKARTHCNMTTNTQEEIPVSDVHRLSLQIPNDDELGRLQQPRSRKASFFIGEHDQMPVTIIGPDNEEICPEDIVVAPDGGWGWVVVFAAFMCNVIVDGTIFSFGVVLVAIVDSAATSDNPVSISTVSWVGGSLTGFYLLAGPFVSSLANKFGFRVTAIIGSGVGGLGLVLAWFFCRDGTPNMLALFTLYGVVGGIGFGLIYVPAVITVGFYFEKKRALATGIAICGSGIGTFLFAPLVKTLINTFEWQGAILIQAGIVFTCAIFASLYRPLEPENKDRKGNNQRGSTALTSPDLTPLLMRIKRARDLEKWDSVNSFDGFEKRRSSKVEANGISEAEKTANQQGEVTRKSSTTSLTSGPYLKQKRLSVPNMLGIVAFQPPTTPVPEAQPDTSQKTQQRSNSVRNKSFAGIPPNLKEIEEEAEHEHSTETPNTYGYSRRKSIPDDGSDVIRNSALTSSTRNIRLQSSSNLEAENEPGKKNTHPIVTLVVSNNVLDVSGSRVFRVASKNALNKPMHRDDIFYSGSLAKIPEYTSSKCHVDQMFPSVEWKAEPVDELAVRVDSKSSRWFHKLSILRKMLDFSLLKSMTFLLLALSGGITMLGFFVPFMYLKAIATEQKLADDQATLLISIIGVANTVGRILCGGVADRLSDNVLLINNSALTIGGLATMLVPFLGSYPLFILYSCLFGMSIACFASLRSILIVNLMGLNKLTNAFGLLLLFQGLAAFVGSPLAGFLRDATGTYDASFYVAGALILLSGVMCYPVNYINQWETKRNQEKNSLIL